MIYPRVDRAVVRRRRARQRRIPVVLLHPRAFRALPHRGASTRPARGTTSCRSLSRAACRGWRSLALGASRTWRDGAPNALGVLVAALRARVGGVRVPVLQRLGVEAAVVHPADVRAARARRRLTFSLRCDRRTLVRLTLPGAIARRFALARRRRSRLRPLVAPTLATGRSLWKSSPRSAPGSRARLRRRPPAASAAAFAFRERRRRRRRPLRGTIAPVAVDAGRGRRSPSPDSTRSARCARPRLSSGRRRRRRPFARDAPFYQIAMYDQTVPFYLGRTTTPRRLPRRARARHRRRARASRFRRWRRGSPQWRALDAGYAVMPPTELRGARRARRADARARARLAARDRESANERRGKQGPEGASAID